MKNMKDNQKVKVVLLNGPPLCGKDTLANYVLNNDGTFIKGQFAFPLKQANKAFFGMTDEMLNRCESDRAVKEKEMDYFFGHSWRGVNIEFAEKYAKKIYGDDVFGKLFVRNVVEQITMPKQGNLHLIVSDCGFAGEVQPLVDEWGAENISVVKISRKGCDYSKDSRGYIDADSLGIKTYDLENVGNQKRFSNNGLTLVKSIVYSS